MLKLIKHSIGCLFGMLSLMLVLAVAVIWLGLSFMPFLIEKVVEGDTGFGLDIGELKINPFTGVADMQQALLTNPGDFPDPGFIHVNQAKIEVEVSSLFKERKVIKELVLDIEELNLVTNEAGEKNARIFRDAMKPSEESGPSPEPSGEPVQFIIEHLVLRLHTVKLSNYSNVEPHIRTKEVNLKLELIDITDMKQVIIPLGLELTRKGMSFLVEPLVQSITGLKGYGEEASEWIQGSAESIGEGALETGKAAVKAGKKVLDKFKKSK